MKHGENVAGNPSNADRHVVGRNKTWPEMKFEKRIEMVHGAIIIRFHNPTYTYMKVHEKESSLSPRRYTACYTRRTSAARAPR